MNPFIGILYHWLGGFMSATNFIPFRRIKRWSWEIYWLIQGVAAWLIAPPLVASIFVPHLFSIIRATSHSTIGWAMLWGALWGVGGLTFGLSIRYLGIALGYSISLGLCTAFGTLIPPLYYKQMGELVRVRSGVTILVGIAVCLLAVVVNGLAGVMKEREITAEQKLELGERDFSMTRGIGVAIFAGIMSSFFAFGLQAGAPIAAIARVRLLAEGHLDLWRNLPVLIVVLWGGFVTNLVWSIVLIIRNRSADQFSGAAGSNPMRGVKVGGDTLIDLDPRDAAKVLRITPRALAANYFFATAAGIIWYFQFFFYSLGQTKMGQYDFASWTLHMASIIIFASLWGLALKEWAGTSRRAKATLALGLSLLIGSTLIVGYGTYQKTKETSAKLAVH